MLDVDEISERVNRELLSTGLCVRGLLNINDEASSTAKGVMLIGHGGGAFWPVFEASDARPDHPLDTWTKQVVSPIAASIGSQSILVTPVYPSDPPYRPFQQWAMAAEGVKPSPLGILIHPIYGLWHAYRAALIFEMPFRDITAPCVDHPCDTCADKPCLPACPVSAFDGQRFHVSRCRDHLSSDAGEKCRTQGCLARQACPVGLAFQYSTEQQRFHMDAFFNA